MGKLAHLGLAEVALELLRLRMTEELSLHPHSWYLEGGLFVLQDLYPPIGEKAVLLASSQYV